MLGDAIRQGKQMIELKDGAILNLNVVSYVEKDVLYELAWKYKHESNQYKREKLLTRLNNYPDQEEVKKRLDDIKNNNNKFLLDGK